MKTKTVNIPNFNSEVWNEFKGEVTKKGFKTGEAVQEALINWIKGDHKMTIKNVVYQTPSFSQAQTKKEEFTKANPEKEYFINSFTAGSRTDMHGVLIEQREYEVFELLK